MPMAPKQYEFINYFDDPDQDAKRVLTKVRTHVMHDYFRREGRKNGRGVSSKHRPCYHVRPKVPAAATKEQRHHSSSGDNSINLAILVSADRPRTKSLATPEHEDERSDGTLQVRVGAVRNMANQHRLDPFDVLPVSGDATFDDLIFWYFHRCECREMSLPWLHPINKMWQDMFWGFASQNRGLFHMLLSLGESNRAIMTGKKNNVASLFHRGQAIRAISEGFSGKLSDDLTRNICSLHGTDMVSLQKYLEDLANQKFPTGRAESSSDSFIMLISQQLNDALGEEDYPAAHAHLRAIIMLLHRRADDFTSGVPLAGLPLADLCWNDVRLAAVTLSAPILPFQPSLAFYSCPKELKDEARRRTLDMMQTIAPVHRCYPQTAFMIANNLHCIGLMFDKDWAPYVDLATAINPYYETIHKLCNLIANVSSPESEQVFNPVNVVLFSTEMFAWSCLPTRIPKVYHSPLMVNIEFSLVRALFKGFIQIEKISTFWLETGATLESLLWVLFIGSAVCSTANPEEANMRRLRPMKPWFFNALKGVVDQLQISDINNFEAKLKIFPWTEHFCSRWCVSFALQMGMDSAGRDLAQEAQKWPSQRATFC